jgi:cation channel sperm-associated protein 3
LLLLLIFQQILFPNKVLVTALLDTLRKWVIHIILLLFLLMFLFAIMGYYFFGYKDDSDKENWGTLDRSMLTLFSYVTVK